MKHSILTPEGVIEREFTAEEVAERKAEGVAAEKKAAEALWKKMTLEQLEKDMHDDDFKEYEKAKKKEEAAMLALNDGDADQLDTVDDVIPMTGRGSLLSAESLSKIEDDEIRSQVSAASQKLIEMGFSEEAAEAAAAESLARRMDSRGRTNGKRPARQDDAGAEKAMDSDGHDPKGVSLPQIRTAGKK